MVASGKNENQLTKTVVQAKDSATKLSIAQIIGGLNIGGAERHFVDLLNEMRANDCTAIFLGQRRGGATLHGQLAEYVETRNNHVRKRSFPLGVWNLRRKLVRKRCKVVHTHMFWANLYGVVAARLAGVPVIVTTEHGENRWKRPYHRWLERNLISKFADIRYCVSSNILQQRRDVDGVPAEKLKLVANGTRVPADPASLWQNPQPVLGSIGRFVTQKNFGLLVEVIAALRQQGYAVRGCIVGDGPEMPAIRRKVADLGLADVIALPGLVTDTDAWFRKFDIYAITSSEEGLPVSLLEAMSYGLPVVASDVGAISTAIKTTEEGTIVPAGDLNRFVEAITAYLDNRDLAADIGRHARDRIIREFSIEAIAASYESDYRAILQQKLA